MPELIPVEFPIVVREGLELTNPHMLKMFIAQYNQLVTLYLDQNKKFAAYRRKHGDYDQEGENPKQVQEDALR